MKIENESTLDEFRGEGLCEFTGHWCPQRHPHHIRARGFGGGFRLDVRVNLIALSPVAHRMVHDGNLSNDRLLEIVAKREGRSPEWIDDFMNWLAREPKERNEFGV